MVEIPPTESTLGFPVPFFFLRTERFVERIIDCTREELIDLNFYYLNMLEEFQGVTERINDRLESTIGFNESMFQIPTKDGQA